MDDMFLAQLVTVAILHLAAVVTPGPTFALVVRNSLVHSRRSGIYTALGLALGTASHVLLALVGVGLVITRSEALFTAVQYLGALYLLYLGYKSLVPKPQRASSVAEPQASRSALSPASAIRTGFLTNFSNPYVILFILTLFTQVVDPATPKAILALYGLEMVTVSFTYFSFISLVLSGSLIRTRVLKAKRHIELVTGVIFIYFAIRLFLRG